MRDPLTKRHISTTFNGNRHLVNGDIMVLVCDLILQDHVTNRLKNIMDRSTSRSATVLASLEYTGILVVEI